MVLVGDISIRSKKTAESFGRKRKDEERIGSGIYNIVGEYSLLETCTELGLYETFPRYMPELCKVWC